MKLKPQINIEINEKSYSYKLFQALDSLSKTYSQRKTAKELNIAHSVLNRRIKNGEDKLGFKLVDVRGSKSYLSNKAIDLLNSYYKYNNSLANDDKIAIVGGHIITGLIDSISEDLPFEVDVYSSTDKSAYKLSKNQFIDILALDDPLIAFENDLDFTAIGYDHLVLVSSDGEEEKEKSEIAILNDLKKINPLKFISVDGTAQRLAWNTLSDNNIPFEIVKEVKSQFDAFKIVKNSEPSDNLYTFLNASYFKGNDVLKDETQHVISLVQTNYEKPKTKEFINYLIVHSQDLIAKQGFIPIKPWKIKEDKE